jgi:Contractile injection system tube protein/LysM domain
MELKKADIYPDGGTAIPILFNPGEYRLGKSNEIAEVETPGLATPILQYVSGKSRTLSMELFFDTFEAGTDVRTHTDRIYGLLEIRKETHAPPLCTFRWGGFSFKGVLESVDGRFTLFFPNGTPARATLSVRFKGGVDIGKEVRKTATESVDRRKTCIVKGGDTLSSIAAAEYSDPGQWRPIARANGITDPLALRPGQRLIVPALT